MAKQKDGAVGYDKPCLPIRAMKWEVSGVIQGRRELKTKDQTRVFAWMINVGGVGASHEIKVTGKAFGQLAEGMHVRVTGIVEFYNNTPQFVARTIAEVQLNDDGLAIGEYPLDITEDAAPAKGR